jgi:hypothetical protein
VTRTCPYWVQEPQGNQDETWLSFDTLVKLRNGKFGGFFGKGKDHFWWPCEQCPT